MDRKALAPESLRSWGIPEFWKDEVYTCVDCGKKVVFTAQKQQQWYEVEKLPIFQRPVRCAEHYQRWRQRRHAKSVMDRALRRLEAGPADRAVMREAALAIVEFHRMTNRGNLQMAVFLLRNARTRKGSVADALTYCTEMMKRDKDADAQPSSRAGPNPPSRDPAPAP